MVGLRSRVVVSFGLLSLLVALAVCAVAYGFARSYLLTQRESTALTRVLLDARAVAADLQAGTEPGAALSRVPVVGDSQALARVGDTWYTRGVTVSPSDLPESLLAEAVRSGAAQQRFAVEGRPVFSVAVSDGEGVYLELIPLDDLDGALRAAGWLMTALVVVAFVLGALIGRWAAGRVMRPLQDLGSGATRVAEGDLDVRLKATGDPDLDPLSAAFNDMADAVQQRIVRERRFVANVGHELRSPVTTVLGTAELLDSGRDHMPPRDAALVSGLVGQARRLSQTLVDLLELGGGSSGSPVQLEATDLAGLLESLLTARSLPTTVLRGDRPLVRTDARRVERVLANVIDNAVAHGEGITRVTIERTPLSVVVHVDDSGPGVPPELAERLFEPFVRGTVGTAARDGAGLGLAIARENADAVGATLDVGVSPSGGARFTLQLPGEAS